jgi:hypothetical protein
VSNASGIFEYHKPRELAAVSTSKKISFDRYMRGLIVDLRWALKVSGVRVCNQKLPFWGYRLK